jgi:hypothetical protein
VEPALHAQSNGPGLLTCVVPEKEIPLAPLMISPVMIALLMEIPRCSAKRMPGTEAPPLIATLPPLPTKEDNAFVFLTLFMTPLCSCLESSSAEIQKIHSS